MRVQLEQQPGPRRASPIDNPTGEIKAMIGGYSFEDSKFNRATQSVRQVGSSFKVYVYAERWKEARRLLTHRDCRLPPSAVAAYSPRNYDEKFEGTITLRRFGRLTQRSRVKLAEKIALARRRYGERFGITTPLPPYCAGLGAAT